MQSKHIPKVLIIFILTFLQSCATSYKYSYEVENSPVFKGDYRQYDTLQNGNNHPSIKVVSFNIEFARHIEKAIDLLRNEPLGNADVLLLQEMDEKGTEFLAKSLNMAYIYYPASFHPKYQKNVGNAILTKWNIKNSRKIKLPHPSTYPVVLEGKNYIFRKTATIANIEIRGELITFACTHAAAFNTTQKRKEFAVALASQMNGSNVQYSVVGGDFNSLGSADINATVDAFISFDFLWASQSVGTTISKKKSILSAVPKDAFQLDHLFVKGMCINNSGKVDQAGISDHLPIWVDLEIEKNDVFYKDAIFK